MAENLVSTITWVGLVVAIGLFLPLPSYAWIASIALGRGLPGVVLVALLSGPGRRLPPWLNTGPLWARAARAVTRLWGAVRESHLGLRDPRQMSVVVVASLAPGSPSGPASTSPCRRSDWSASAGAAPGCCW